MDRVCSPSSEWLGARTKRAGRMSDGFLLYVCLLCIPSVVEYISAYLHLPRATTSDVFNSCRISRPEWKSFKLKVCHKTFAGLALGRSSRASSISPFNTLVGMHELTCFVRSYLKSTGFHIFSNTVVHALVETSAPDFSGYPIVNQVAVVLLINLQHPCVPSTCGNRVAAV